MAERSNRMLDGIVVADFSMNVAGPFAGMILGDLGAKVIKVEKPGGDDARHVNVPSRALDAKASLAECREMRAACHEGDIGPCRGQTSAKVAADPAGPEDCDPHKRGILAREFCNCPSGV